MNKSAAGRGSAAAMSDSRSDDDNPGPLAPAQILAYGFSAAAAPTGNKMRIARRQPDAHDVGVRVQFCGLCGTDAAMIDDQLGLSEFPLVPGHEITGVVIVVGRSVTKFSAGERVGVGYLADSCRACLPCRTGREQYCCCGGGGGGGDHRGGARGCSSSSCWTVGYNYALAPQHVKGGFSTFIAVDEKFVFHLPMTLSLAEAAPLLCAGASVYSALRRQRVAPGTNVAVVGMGGRGHLAVRMAAAMGARVCVVEATADKADDARKFGAARFVLRSDADAMATIGNKFDLVVDTAGHDVDQMLGLLRCDGRLVMLRISGEKVHIDPMELARSRRSVTAASAAGAEETQQMLDFCAMQRIKPAIELINIDQLPDALEKLRNGQARYRFVLDIDSIRETKAEGRENKAEHTDED